MNREQPLDPTIAVTGNEHRHPGSTYLRLSPTRAAGKTTTAPSRAERRAITAYLSRQGELAMRRARTAARVAKRKRG